MALTDIVGAALISGMLVLMVIGLTSTVSETTTMQTLDLMTQESLVTIVRMIEHDFHKMGYQSVSGTSIVTMNTDGITFWAGIDSDGDGASDGLNMIQYVVSGPSEASSTPNPNDRILYRTVGGENPVQVALGVTEFMLRFYNSSGHTTGDPSQVKAIGVTLTVQSTIDYNGQYTEAKWRKVISPRNL